MSFWCLQFLPKMNENESTWGIIVVKPVSFVRFSEEFTAWQFAFEINWTLKADEKTELGSKSLIKIIIENSLK